MNDKTIALVEQLAAQLGTTAEFLWGVLLRQAMISGITDILQYIVLAAAVYAFVRWIKSEKRDFGSGGDSWPASLIMGITLAIIVIAAFFSFPNTITAFVNPEYWALDKVLSTVKSKSK